MAFTTLSLRGVLLWPILGSLSLRLELDVVASARHGEGGSPRSI